MSNYPSVINASQRYIQISVAEGLQKGWSEGSQMHEFTDKISRGRQQYRCSTELTTNQHLRSIYSIIVWKYQMSLYLSRSQFCFSPSCIKYWTKTSWNNSCLRYLRRCHHFPIISDNARNCALHGTASISYSLKSKRMGFGLDKSLNLSEQVWEIACNPFSLTWLQAGSFNIISKRYPWENRPINPGAYWILNGAS